MSRKGQGPGRGEVSRGGGSRAGRDPEAGKSTEARPALRRSRSGDEPEEVSAIELDERDEVHDEGSQAADEDWEAPPGRMSREVEAPDERYETGAAYADLGEANDYQTGSDYDAHVGDKELEGDGLDALDPELPESTRLENDDDDDDEGEGDGDGEEGSGDDDDEPADDANATHAGPPVKLEIIAGPDTGKKAKFRGVRLVIGRTAGVDVQLSDQSVSRRHVELVQGDGGVLLRDLGSGNGTKVNGEKVAEKVLEHGDEIHIGKTKLRFVDEVAAFQKARDEKEAAEKAAEDADAKEAEGEAKAADGEAKEGDGAEAAEGDAKDRPLTARQKGEAPPQGLLGKLKAMPAGQRLVVLGGGGLLLLLVLIGAALALKPSGPPPPDPRQELASLKLQQAQGLVREYKLEEALAMIDEAEAALPGSVEATFKSRVRDELSIKKGLDEVRALAAQGRLDDAKDKLAKVPKGSLRAEDERKTVEAELQGVAFAAAKAKIEELIAAGEADEARTWLARAAPLDQPALGAEIDKMQEELKAAQNAEVKNARANAAAAANAAKNRRNEAVSAAFGVVLRKFAGQEWARAAAECDRVLDAHRGDAEVASRARRMQAQIPLFGKAYEEGTKKFREGALAQAAKPLRKAREAYRIIGLDAPFGTEIDEKLAQAALSAGKEALVRDDLAGAAFAFREALQLDPGEAKAKQGLETAIEKADELYQEAYMIRDREPREAMRKLKIVLEVAPKGSATHDKAKAQLGTLEP